MFSKKLKVQMLKGTPAELNSASEFLKENKIAYIQMNVTTLKDGDIPSIWVYAVRKREVEMVTQYAEQLPLSLIPMPI